MKTLSCFLLLLLLLPDLFAQNHVIYDNTTDEALLIGQKVSFLEDVEGSLSIKDIIGQEVQANFQLNDSEAFARPTTASVYWFKFTIENHSDQKIWLSIGNSLSWYIDLYSPDSLGNYNAIQAGSLRSKEHLEYPIINGFWLPLNHINQPQTYYLRVEQGYYPFDIPLHIGTIWQLNQIKQTTDILTAGFVGLVLIMLLYNLFIYFSTKDKIYLLYTIFLIKLSIILTYINYYPLIDDVTFRSTTFWYEHPLAFGMSYVIVIGLFCIEYLNLETYAKKTKRTIQILLAIISLIAVLDAFGLMTHTMYSTFQGLVQLLHLICIISAIILFRKLKQARFYILGWSFFVASLVIYTLEIYGILPYNIYIKSIVYLGAGMEVWMFSLALGDRLNILKREKEQAQKEKLNLIESQKKNLEQTVKTRTVELRESNEELLVMNEELQQTQEEIVSQRDLLASKNEELFEHQNRIGKSIQSALLIQQAILPSPDLFHSYFSDHFILYRPKDIVSGDFYWVNKHQGKLILIEADCTGHGIAGAFMSLIGYSIFNQVILQNHYLRPAQIMEKVHNQIYKSLKQDTSGSLEGMDMSILVIDIKENYNQVNFGGAGQDLYYAIKSQDLKNVSGSRRKIGGFSNSKHQFNEHTLKVSHGTRLYLSSDGFIDQNNKQRQRVGKQSFQKFLMTIQNTSMSQQLSLLESMLDEHQQYENQRDDITVIGIQL